MIIYNNRYRGPLEYEKFTLNILNLFNAFNSLNIYELDLNKEDSLASLEKTINNIYLELIGDENKDGVCSTFFKELYLNNRKE